MAAPSQGKTNLLRDPEKRAAVKASIKARPWYLNQRSLGSHLFFGPYVLFPILATLMWWGGLLALIGIWAAQGKPTYEAEESTIVVYVSDVGADNHKLFIAITAVTAAFYILSLWAERWLRHLDRLPADVRRRERYLDWAAIIFGTIAAIALLMLGIFDAFNHSTVHWSMTVIFVLGTAISAIFQSGEIWSLHKDHPDRQHLRRNSILKLIVVTLAVAIAIAFAACYGVCRGNNTSDRCNKVTGAAGALEWACAFMLGFYFVTLAMDLWPAGKTSSRYLRRLAKWQEKHEPHNLEHDFTGRNAFSQYPERWQGTDGQALPPNAPEVTPYGAPAAGYSYGNNLGDVTPVRNSMATYSSDAPLRATA